MSNNYIKTHQPEVDKTIEHFKTEIASLRTGRANPALVENIFVEAYGVKTPLIQLASISVPEARTINIEPWDKNLVKDVEKGINVANLGFQAVVDGNLIRITMPQMTQEDREKLVKILKEKHEATKISIRNIREKIKEEIVAAEKNKDLTEDDRYNFVEELDKEIENWNKKLNEIAENKEAEIMKI